MPTVRQHHGRNDRQTARRVAIAIPILRFALRALRALRGRKQEKQIEKRKGKQQKNGKMK